MLFQVQLLPQEVREAGEKEGALAVEVELVAPAEVSREMVAGPAVPPRDVGQP